MDIITDNKKYNIKKKDEFKQKLNNISYSSKDDSNNFKK